VPKYRKKPVEIEAQQLTRGNVADVAAWCKGDWSSGSDAPPVPASIDIETLEGRMRANEGDYVIRGVQGEFYPCKPDIFEATYDAVSG
jgi:hypothetical protein